MPVDTERYAALDALGLAELIRAREITPEEALYAAIARIERLDPRVGAIVEPLYERARARIAAGVGDGPFAGVPFVVKDAIAIEDVHLSFGSAFLRKNVARHTHPLIERAEAAGLVIVGRTNMCELGLVPLTEPLAYGPTRNPWSLDHSPGGSSGGSAAAVAARMVPIAHGNDGGGSIRIPASACGLVGLKPSRGRIPGTAEDLADGLVGELCLTRTVRDTAAFLDAVHGPRPGDRWWAPPPERPYLEVASRDPRPLRISFSHESVSGAAASPEVRRVLEAAARRAEALGHHVEPGAPAIDGEAFREAFVTVWASMTAYVFDSVRAEIGRLPIPGPVRKALSDRRGFELATRALALRPGPPPFEPTTRRIHALGARRTAGDVYGAWATLQAASYRLAEHFERFDVWLTPTLAEPPWRIGQLDLAAPLDALIDEVLAYAGFTPIANAAGTPAISLPLGSSGEGLPIGVQALAGFGREDLLLGLAGQLERAEPWADRRPAFA